MTDTRHPGLITPDNAPRLADLNDDSTPYPCPITVFCDECGDELGADYLVPADSTSADRLEIARDHMRTKLGWMCGKSGDFCPDCAAPNATPAAAWFFASMDETADSDRTFTTLEAAKHAAIIDWEAGDTGPGIPPPDYTWITDEKQPGHHVLLDDGVVTGWWVQPVDETAGAR